MGSINYSDTKKRGGRNAPGWLISLLSKLGLEGLAGGTGAAGSAVVGTASSGISGLWGGLLATKAGIVALVLAATTVAGGIYVATVPGSVSNFAGGVGGGISSLFSGSSRSPSVAAGGQGAAAGGSQDSIQSFQAANQGQVPDPNQRANASADTANNPPSAGGNAPAPDNSYSSGGSARPKLATTQGLNGSNSTGAGGGNLVASLPPGAANGTGANAAVSGHSRNMGGSNQISAAGLTASRRFGSSAGRSAMQQLGATNGAVRGNLAQAGGPSSQGSGYTYDGGRGGGGMIGGGAGNIAGGGTGVGGGGVGHDGVVNPPTMNKILPPPPVGQTQNVTPWQGAIKAAMGAMAIALMAFMVMRYFKKKAMKTDLGTPAFASDMMMAKIAGMVAMAAAAVATMMGILIMSYGQKTQGMMWTAIGGIFTAIAAYSWFRLDTKKEEDAQKDALHEARFRQDQIQNILKDNHLEDKFHFDSSGRLIANDGTSEADRIQLGHLLNDKMGVQVSGTPDSNILSLKSASPTNYSTSTGAANASGPTAPTDSVGSSAANGGTGGSTVTANSLPPNSIPTSMKPPMPGYQAPTMGSNGIFVSNPIKDPLGVMKPLYYYNGQWSYTPPPAPSLPPTT